MLDRDKLVEAFDNFRRKLGRLGMGFIALTAIGYWQSPFIAAVLQRPNPLPLVYYAPAEAFLTAVHRRRLSLLCHRPAVWPGVPLAFWR
jgi:hypothetical protein